MLLLLLVMAVSVVVSGQEEPDRNTSIQMPFSVSVIAWSPDGTKIAVGGGESPCAKENEDTDRFDILIIDVQTLRITRSLSGFACRVSDVDWKPDGTQLAGASFDILGFRVWDVDLGDVVAIDHLGGQGSVSVRWHPTLEELMVTGGGNGIGIFDASTGEYLRSPHVGGQHTDWNPDGTQFVTSSGYEREIYIADTVTGERIATIETPTTRNGEIDWSPDGTKLASAGSDGRVRVWNAADGQLIAVFIADAYELKWSPDSQYLAIQSTYEFVQLRHVESKRIIENIKPLGTIYAFDWSPDGTQIAFGGADTSGNPPQVMIVDAPQLPDIEATVAP